ncbi:MAG: biotin/lipoyl-containing protein [Anaerovoracaceae bacterium]|jgi:biotin carboxyl carrier protein
MEVLSPLTGKVLEINVKVGDTITEDDEVVIIEAMKMETPAYGENGVVKEILIKVGDLINEEDVMMILE